MSILNKIGLYRKAYVILHKIGNDMPRIVNVVGGKEQVEPAVRDHFTSFYVGPHTHDTFKLLYEFQACRRRKVKGEAKIMYGCRMIGDTYEIKEFDLFKS